MLTRTARVALNTLTNYLTFAVSIVVFFLLTPYLIDKLGTDNFGLWSLTLSVLGFFGLMEFGLGTSVVKFVAECRGSGDIERRNRMVSTILVVYVLLALAAGVGIAVLSLFYNHIFQVPVDARGKALLILWILAARSVLLNFPLGIFHGLLFGEQRIYLINIVQSADLVLYALAAWALLAYGYGIVALAWLGLIEMVFEHMVFMALAWRTTPGLRISPRLADRGLFGEALSFSGYNFVINIAVLVLLRTDPIIVKFFASLKMVAIYAVALKIAERANLFLKQFVSVVSPLVAEFKGSGDRIKIKFVLVNCTRFALAPTLMLAVPMWLFARDAIVFWVGGEFALAGDVLAILMVATVAAVPQGVSATVLTMTGHHRWAAFTALAGMATNIVVSIVLAVLLPGDWKLLGIAAGTVVATFGVDFIAVTARACAVYGVSRWEYVRRALLPPLLPAALDAGCTWGLARLLPPSNLGMLALETAPGAIVFAAVFWLFCVEPSEKDLFAARLWRWRHGAEPPAPAPPTAAAEELGSC